MNYVLNSYASHHSPASSSRFSKCSLIDMSSHVFTFFQSLIKNILHRKLYGIPETHFDSILHSLSCTSEPEGYNKAKIMHETNTPATRGKEAKKPILHNETKNK